MPALFSDGVAPAGASSRWPVVVNAFKVNRVPTGLGLRLDKEVPPADDLDPLALGAHCLWPRGRVMEGQSRFTGHGANSTGCVSAFM